MRNSQLCSVEELQSLIEHQHVSIIDGSWYLPSQNIDTRHAFEQGHIPGARFFDIDSISDQNSDLPHMLPSTEQFSKELSTLGISNQSQIVIYDSAGLFSAARVWWTFKVFGHDNVRVLDGGLPAWVEANGKLEKCIRPVAKSNYVARFNEALVIDKTTLIENVSNQQYLVLDARPEERFLGTSPEPRPGLPSGHMPDSVSLSASRLINQGRLKPREQLQQLFSELDIDASTPVATSCGSGVTAAIITLALAESGLGLNRLYDGSWAEWGAANDTPIMNRSD